MPFDPEKENTLLESKLRELRKKEYLPADLIDLLASVYTTQIAARAVAKLVLPASNQLAPADIHAQGAPLVSRPDLPFDLDQARDLFNRFLDLLGSQSATLHDAALTIAAHCAEHPEEIIAAFQAYRNMDEAYFQDWAGRTAEAPRTMAFLVQAAMSPSLAAAAEALAVDFPPERIWEHGHCPVCGSQPLLASLEEKEGLRHLTCAYCQTHYRAVRLGCPFCGEKDSEKVSFFHTPDEPSFKVHVCVTCSLYIKTADFRQMDKVALPLFDDLESLPLDMLAQKQGYKRPTPSGWGF